MKFGGNITLSNLAAFVTTSGDNMIVGLTAGKVPLGLYDRSYNLVVQPISQMMAPLNRVAVPLLSRFAGEAEQYRATYLQMFRISTLLTVPAMPVCISNGGAVIGALLGPRWSATAPIFSWISVGGLTVGLYSSTVWLFITQNRSPELRLYSALAAAINVASYLIGAFWGVIGIATAASIGYVFVTTPLMLFGATRKGPVSLADAVNCSVPFAIESIIVYAVLTLGLRGSALHDIPRVIVATLLSYGFFVGLALVSAANRQLLRGGIRMLKSQR